MIAPWTMNSIKCSVSDVIQTTNTSATAKQLNPFTTYKCWSHSIWCGFFPSFMLSMQIPLHVSRARAYKYPHTRTHTHIWQKWAHYVACELCDLCGIRKARIFSWANILVFFILWISRPLRIYLMNSGLVIIQCIGWSTGSTERSLEYGSGRQKRAYLD